MRPGATRRLSGLTCDLGTLLRLDAFFISHLYCPASARLQPQQQPLERRPVFVAHRRVQERPAELSWLRRRVEVEGVKVFAPGEEHERHLPVEAAAPDGEAALERRPLEFDGDVAEAVVWVRHEGEGGAATLGPGARNRLDLDQAAGVGLDLHVRVWGDHHHPHLRPGRHRDARVAHKGGVGRQARRRGKGRDGDDGDLLVVVHVVDAVAKHLLLVGPGLVAVDPGPGTEEQVDRHQLRWFPPQRHDEAGDCGRHGPVPPAGRLPADARVVRCNRLDLGRLAAGARPLPGRRPGGDPLGEVAERGPGAVLAPGDGGNHTRQVGRAAVEAHLADEPHVVCVDRLRRFAVFLYHVPEGGPRPVRRPAPAVPLDHAGAHLVRVPEVQKGAPCVFFGEGLELVGRDLEHLVHHDEPGAVAPQRGLDAARAREPLYRLGVDAPVVLFVGHDSLEVDGGRGRPRREHDGPGGVRLQPERDQHLHEERFAAPGRGRNQRDPADAGEDQRDCPLLLRAEAGKAGPQIGGALEEHVAGSPADKPAG